MNVLQRGWIGLQGPALVGIMAFVVLGLAPSASSNPGHPFSDFYGAWRGGGSALFSDGKRERLRCTAYYTGAKRELRLAIRCASPSNRIDMRAVLMAKGETVTGMWEERTFNAAGQSLGRIADNKLKVKISGAVEGELIVTTGAVDQLVSVKSAGTVLEGVNLKLKRQNRGKRAGP